jgi:hypothetical protein
MSDPQSKVLAATPTKLETLEEKGPVGTPPSPADPAVAKPSVQQELDARLAVVRGRPQ